VLAVECSAALQPLQLACHMPCWHGLGDSSVAAGPLLAAKCVMMMWQRLAFAVVVHTLPTVTAVAPQVSLLCCARLPLCSIVLARGSGAGQAMWTSCITCGQHCTCALLSSTGSMATLSTM
jgi:hypothetical protein